MTIALGTLIGQYRVESLLGEGGMGAVYYGEHVVLGRPAAIKVLLPHVARDPSLVQRFINEARIAAQMNHRNVVDVLDCGMFPAADAPGAQWYIALEYLHGVSLGAFIAERGGQPIELPTVVQIIAEAANGLHAAHVRHQLVHRDVKPDNLYVVHTEDDPLRVKILDFGIAKLRQPGSGIQTQSQTAMGTPAYAAPEQLRESKDVDARADVWALGVIAHEMVTGVRPWGSTTSVWEIIRHHAGLRQAPDPRAFRPDTPAKVAEAIAKAMEPDPSRRWPSTKAFARALAEGAPMPYSGNGMAILEKYAPELARAGNDSLTVGRRLPPELQASPPEIVTAQERPAPRTPMTISDGVPRAPGTVPIGSPGTMPVGGEPVRPISTLSGSAGQSAPTAERRSRRGLGLGIGAVAVAGVAIGVALLVSRGSGAPAGTAAGQPDHGAVTMDAAMAAKAANAAPAMSALAVMTDPDGAEVTVDGVSKGSAPVNLRVRVGATVEVRAIAPGHVAASQSVTVTATPATVRLTLDQMPEPDAGATATSHGAAHDTGSHRRERRTRGKEPGQGKGSGSGSGSNQPFNPNDVL